MCVNFHLFYNARYFRQINRNGGECRMGLDKCGLVILA